MKKPKDNYVHSPALCQQCASKQCVFHIGDIKADLLNPEDV